MVTVHVLLRVSLFALLCVEVHNAPVKGFKSKDQGIPSDPVAADHFGSQQGSASSNVYFMPPQDQVVTGSYLPSQGEFISSGSEPAAYAAGLSMPADMRYAAIPEQSETQAAPSEMNWFVPPPNFEETTHIQPDDASIVGPSAPQAPIPQPGEASNTVKEAELGNYEQLTEHFGFPASNVGPVQGFQYAAVPDFHDLWENQFLYPEFDYMLIYGLYPPGTYSTFSQHHEKGKEHSQEVHYLKEHGPDSPQNPEPGQQKLFPGTP